MRARDWLAAHRQDEREALLHGRAGQAAYLAMSLACVVLEFVYLVQGRSERALDVVLILGVGQIVYFGQILIRRATR
jgi:hypothetical protein